MSLPESSLDHVGKLLCFKPMYGWGWFQLDSNREKAPTDYAPIDKAGDFPIRVQRFFSYQGELRGIVGRVEQTGHLFDGLWIVTWTMLVGEFDFTERLCWRWDSELSPHEPTIDEWPTAPEIQPAWFGFGGVLAVSQAAIETWSAAFSGQGAARQESQ